MAYDIRAIVNEVRAALEYRAATEAGTAAGGESAEDEIARRTVALLLQLRSASSEMADINKAWLANGITAKIGAAAQAQTTLAGYSPAVWAQWGAVLPVVTTFLADEYAAAMPDGTTHTETPEQTLQRRYQKVQE